MSPQDVGKPALEKKYDNDGVAKNEKMPSHFIPTDHRKGWVMLDGQKTFCSLTRAGEF